MNKKYFHAIKLITSNCTGCTKCVRVCPTEALRVRNGKVSLDEKRCIDCGNCITACDFDAIRAVSDKLEKINDFQYKIAILSTAFKGQFPHRISNSKINNALHHIGFDEVVQESSVINIMIKIIRDYINTHSDLKPIISSHCPSVVRLIQLRFPSLLPNLMHIEAPMRILAMFLKEKISQEKNLNESEIGVFTIVPSIANVTASHQPEGTYKNAIDGAISIRDIFAKIIEVLPSVKQNNTNEIDHLRGMGWAISNIQAEEVNDGKLKTLAVSGIQNVIEILAKIENMQIDNYDYVVLNNCTEGCVGGILNVENPFVTMSRIRDLIRNTSFQEYHDQEIFAMYKKGSFNVKPLEPRSIMTLDKDIKTALSKMKKIDTITEKLPGLDCSACGSPTCRVLAEDIVKGKASLSDCIILQRKRKRGEK